MIRSERIAKRINEKIKVWSKDYSKLIVAIDGYAGAGKTTVADFIAKQNPDVLIIHLDDFIKHWKDRKWMMDHSKKKSKVFEYDWFRYGDLEQLINTFKTKNKGLIKLKTYDYNKNDFGPLRTFNLSKKILVIDGIFLFHPRHKINENWNKTVYLDADLAKADKKRIARERNSWGKEYIPEDYPDNWIKYYKEAYQRYIKLYKPQKNRDLIFRI